MDNQISAKMLLLFKIKVTVKNKTGFELNAMRKNLPKSIKHCLIRQMKMLIFQSLGDLPENRATCAIEDEHRKESRH